MSNGSSTSGLLSLTTEIVAAHVGNNTVPIADLPHLIDQVYKTLVNTGTEQPPAPPTRWRRAAAISTISTRCATICW